VAFADPSKGADEHGAGDGLIKAPMHGKVVAMMVAVGDQVMRGQRLAVVEAMKMEHGLAAPCDGTVKAVHAAEGQQVGEGSVMIEIDTKPE
jgi:3-methylcrotonyl-CoA carboxylase alpha subunit